MDISSLSKEDLSRLVFNDEITNLYNRRFFNHYLNEKITQGNRSNLLSLLMIDIDYFKKINDTYGHLEGDNVLQQLGAIIRETVGSSGLPIRYAGDEFSVILPFIDKKESLKLAEVLLNSVGQNPFHLRDTNQPSFSIKISIGISSFPDDAQSPVELIDQADKALYLSKREGRNRISISGAFSEEEVLERNILDNFPCPHFIGRQEFYHDILQYLTTFRGDKNPFVLIEGPVGVGKSRLLKELNSRPDAFPLYASCNEIDANIPYKSLVPFLTTISESDDSVTGKVLEELSTEMLTELRKLFPEFGKSILLSDVTSIKETEQNRKLLFDSLVYLFSTLSQKRPLLLLFDEFQNIDPATLLIIQALCDDEKSHIIIVAAIRDEYTPILASLNRALEEFLSEISETENYRYFLLSLFDLVETKEMISKIFPHRLVDNSFDEKVYQTTKGNPLFVEELLKYLFLKNLIKYKNKQWALDLAQIPSDIWHKDLDTIIEENINLFDAEAQTVIKRATVIGQDVPLNLLQGMMHQNEGETIDAIDKARRFHIIEPQKPLKEDQFTFLNRHLQQVVYQNIEETERKILHQEAGEVAERIYQDKLDSVAPTLAFHFTKAGNEAKASVYEERVENTSVNLFRKDESSEYYSSQRGIVQSKIKESLHPLSSQRMGLVKDLLRHLISTNKSMQLYPDGSQIIIISSAGLMKIMKSIFEEAEVFTFSESKNTLNINTLPLDSKTHGTAVNEFLSLLKDHYIKSVTFRNGVTDQEIERLMRNLDRSHDKPFSTRGYWNNFLEEKGITNIGIAQRLFIATKEKTVSSALSTTADKIELNTVIVSVLKDFFRYFCAAVENIKLYPPGSQLAIESMKYVNTSIENVFNHIPVLNLSVSEDILLINGTPGHSRLLGTASTTLVKIIQNYQLKTISFIKGASKEELETLIQTISGTSSEDAKNKSSKDWNDLLAQKGITNIKIGAMVYTATGTRRTNQVTSTPTVDTEAVTDQPASEQVSFRHSPKQYEKPLANFSALMKSLPDRLLDDDALKIAEELLRNNEEEKFNQFYQKFLRNFKSSRPEIRSQVHSAYQKLLKQLTPDILIDKTLDIILDGLRTEQTPMVFNPLSNSVIKHAVHYLEKRNYSLLKTVIREVLVHPPEKEVTKSLNYKLFTALKENVGFKELLKDFFNTNADIKNTAQEIITSFGVMIVPDLIALIKDTEDHSSREVVAIIVNQCGPESHQLFINELKATTDDIPTKRLLSVSHLIQTADIEHTIAEFIKGPLYEQALDAVAKLNRSQALSALLPLLNDKDNNLVLSVLTILETLQYSESVEPLLNILENSTDSKIHLKVCKVLVKLQDKKAVPVLTKLLAAKRFLGLAVFGGVSDKIRGNAAWALGEIKTPEAQQALNSALNDKSPHIRSVAKLSLKNYDEGEK